MQQRTTKPTFLGLLALFLMPAAFCQLPVSRFLKQSATQKPMIAGVSSQLPALSDPFFFFSVDAATSNPSPVAFVSPRLYVENLVWSCRQEWKLEKATSIPFRIRLGSKEQVDWLEGKHSKKW